MGQQAPAGGLSGLELLNVPRSEIPAVTHALLEAVKARTGCPVVVNTSFNVRGEPIVCTPADAFRCFMGTDIDCLAVGNCFLRKEDQDPALARGHADSFEPD